MSMATMAKGSAVTPMPFDYDSAEIYPDWRRDLEWPVPHGLSFDCSYRALQAMLAAVWKIDDADLRDVALLSLGMAYSSSLPSAEAALAVARETAFDLQMAGAAPEIEFLRGGTDTVPPARDIGVFRAVQKPSLAFARRLARIRSWTSWLRLPGTLLSPRAVAISHNGLLREAARDARIGFNHAETLFSELRNRHAGVVAIAGWQDIVDLFANALASAYELPTGIRERLRSVAARQIAAILEAAAKDIAALRAVRRMPGNIWAGTGGAWPSRALAIEVLRRGGHVRRFDHGGGMGLNNLPALWTTTELSVSSEFTLPTPALAKNVEESGARAYLQSGRTLALTGGCGEPLHRAASRIERTPGTGARRVTYTPISLIGYRQMMPPRLPDLVNLDWQMRFCESLKALPVDLTCRPHPVGLFSNRPNPLSNIVPFSPRVFEDLISDTDVFVFDYIQSTTFYEALCTDRPIVLIDFGIPVYAGPMRDMLAARCRIVPAWFDDRNRPHVDPERLAYAICSNDAAADPSGFRKLLAGEVD